MSRLDLGSTDDLARQVEKLHKINRALIQRAERAEAPGGEAFANFQAAVSLESQVRQRTRALGQALEDLQQANTDLEIAKTQAEQARADLSNAIEAVREGFALFGADDRLVMRNTRFCSLLPDVKARLTAGMAFADYVDAVAESDVVAVADRAEWAERRHRVHRRRAASFSIELSGDRWLQVAEHKTPDGGTAILQTEVTDLVRLERLERDKLLDTQARMIRATLDHLGQGVAIFDAEARLIGFNERLRDLITPPADLLRTGTSFRAIADYFRFKRLFREGEALRALGGWVERQDRAPLALALSTHDDVYLDLLCEGTPDGGFVISLTDITAQRRAALDLHAMNETLESRVDERTAELSAARDAAQKANVSKSRFVAAVSHDLLQPVNAAKLFLASLGEEPLAEKPAELVAHIGAAFDNMESILSALLDITRLDSGEAAVNVSTVPLAPMLSAIATEFRPMADAKGLALRVAEVPGDLAVRSDPTYLRRIAQNLISNAIRYTRAGSVEVSARSQDEIVTLRVADTGPGIPPDKHALIFQEFQRGSQPDAEPGMGLGLAIVEQACKALDHSLRLDSAPGKGTCFEIGLARATDTTGVRPRRGEPAAAGDLGATVALVIENDEQGRAATCNLLETWGVHTVEAHGASAAMELIQEIGITPDVILSDLHLDDADGFGAVAALRAAFGPIPAVMVSADRSAGLMARAEALDLPLLHKPVEPARLRAVLVWLRTRGGEAS